MLVSCCVFCRWLKGFLVLWETATLLFAFREPQRWLSVEQSWGNPTSSLSPAASGRRNANHMPGPASEQGKFPKSNSVLQRFWHCECLFFCLIMLENFKRSVNLTEWGQWNFQGEIHSAKRLWHLFAKKKRKVWTLTVSLSKGKQLFFLWLFCAIITCPYSSLLYSVALSLFPSLYLKCLNLSWCLQWPTWKGIKRLCHCHTCRLIFI